MTGNEYASLIAAYLSKNYGSRGLLVYREVSLGKSIIGKNRRVDVFALHRESQKALAIECKVQTSTGTADEKIPYTLQDLAAMHVPAFVVYAGAGFSEGVLHLLRSSELAAYCLPDATLEPSSDTLELDHLVAMTFGWWEAVLRDKKPFDLPAWEAARSDSAGERGSAETPAPSRIVGEAPLPSQLELEAR
ncbi:MAG TPA: PD-(D/E)XK nuclease superfamily protein [Polyangiaceae bacterium]|jgi:hypothetical protein|nr:PD-(D/E)XK nuclease superfamily protein [Polyangiaceae bacterium]